MAKQGKRDKKAGRSEAVPDSGAVESRVASVPRWQMGLCALAIVVAGVATYANSFNGAFVFDDHVSIVENPSIRRLSNLATVLRPPPDTTVMGRPVVNLSLALSYAIGGLDARHFHFVNLAIHIAAALLLFGIVRRTLLLPALRDRYNPLALWLASIITLLWLVHPLQTGAVTYIVQRAESLMGLFYLLTLYCFLRGATAVDGKWWHAAAVTACAVGMGCKEVMATVPAIVLLYDWLFLSGHIGTLRQRWRVHASLAATWLILVVIMLTMPSSIAPKTVVTNSTSWEYARSQPGVILHYLKLAAWPDDLCLDYLWPIARTAREIVPGAIVVGGLLAATGWALLKGSAWGFLGAWFFIILAPTSSVVVLGDLAFEHRMYLPLAALIGAAVCGIVVAGQKWLTRPGGRFAALGLAGLVVVSLAVRTTTRNADYVVELDMWQKIAAQRPRNPRAFNNLGHRLQLNSRVPEAIARFRQAIELKPGYAEAYSNLGYALIQTGELPEAIASGRKATELKPTHAEAHNNLGIALAQSNRFEEAIASFRKAIALKPDYANAYNNLGNALDSSGHVDDAVAAFKLAIQYKPEYVNAYINLGNTLGAAGRLEEAVGAYRQAIQWQPDHVNAHRNLAATLRTLGRVDEAKEHERDVERLGK